ncbi:two component transcriptional regulator, LytTR family [Cyclobacterium lianum]|uniref:Two component transcriptional regulator, LytTR family n=1 Tax=Cyclobacterium lianum TaxID=388280 RepID=A0A1M7P8W6_9BACT|nr:response regulator [Cyclobacterium lianum]SHN13223.1 two component transcriptional regulator, LytTR family [Cyclobacterium lianum]
MIRIMIIEDDLVLATHLAQQLNNTGYQVSGIKTNGPDAILHFEKFQPQLLLVDIGLGGGMDGIETVSRIQEENDTTVIFLTGNDDQAHFEKARETQPFAFISKPFNFNELLRTLALATARMEAEQQRSASAGFYPDSIFIRNQNKLVKILYDDIHFVEAERNYSKIHTGEQSFLVVSPLKTLAGKLPAHLFIRIHRSYLVSIPKIDAIGDGFLEVNRRTIPVSKHFKQALLKKINAL